MAASLRTLISQHKPLIAPLAYDGLSARIVRALDFEAAYVGSFAVSASQYGLPDIGFVGLDDMADVVRRLAPIVEVPLIVDGENGFGNAIHVGRTVKVLEQAGAAATHIEDHIFGKHLGGPQVIPVGQAVDKIKAALDARASDDFLIIARSDALVSEGEEATIDRLLTYQEAGADLIFLARAQQPGEVQNKRLGEEGRVPIVMTNAPGWSAADLVAQGADVVLYPTTTYLAAEASIRKALGVLRAEESTMSIDGDYKTFEAFDEFLGIREYAARAQELGLVPQT